MAWRFYAIDATLSPWPHRLDGVELTKVHRDGLTPDEALLDMSAQWVLRLKDEDLDDLLLLSPPETHTQLRENFHKWRQIAAHNAEQVTG